MDVLKKLRSNTALQAIVVSFLTFVVYVITRRAGNPYNQYVLLTDAFLNGQLHLVDPPAFLEIAKFGDKAFVIDPPAPTLFLLPFVAIFGTGADHVLVSCGVGAVAVGFIWVAARHLWDDVRFCMLITALVAIGTNLWWLSSDGGFWSFAHVSAVFFLAAAFAEATGKRRPLLVGICVGLAALSRLPVFLIAPFFAYLVLGGDLRWRRENVERLVAFGSMIGVAAALYLMYNQLRYGTFTDQGYYHPQYVDEPWFQEGRFDLSYIPRHAKAISYELPARIDRFPYVAPKYIGLALTITTPAFLYAFRARLTGRNTAAALSILLVAIPLVTHGAVGFSQFGYRYVMDILPPLLVLTASGMRERVTKPMLAVFAFCVLVNLWGTLAFNKFDWVV